MLREMEEGLGGERGRLSNEDTLKGAVSNDIVIGVARTYRVRVDGCPMAHFVSKGEFMMRDWSLTIAMRMPASCLVIMPKSEGHCNQTPNAK